ncbi:MAG: RecX family transcriptional regulator [Clostridia bacterium]|nr:RecX family transcriptional regulator [Clostridia bacterium]
MIRYKITRVNDTPSGIYCDFTQLSESGEGREPVSLQVSISDYYDAHLREGKVITDECFEALYEASCVAKAVKQAEWVLSGGDHSKKGLVAKLLRGKIDKVYAERAALIMEERGFIDEYAQAERCARAYCTRKYRGKKRIIQELLIKGYERDAAVAAASFISPDEYMEALKTVIERKYPNAPTDKKEKDKRIASLMRLGFSLSEITEAFREVY